MKEEDLRPTAVELCLAIKAGKSERIEDLADKLLLLSSKPEVTGELLGALKSVFTAASRQKDTSIFIKLLEKSQAALLELLERSQFHKEYLELLNALLFVSCDKKLVGTANLLNKLCRGFFVKTDAFSRESWCQETLSLAARMLRRCWVPVGQWLLLLLLKLVWKSRNGKLLQNLLNRAELHMILSCRYDGLEKTLASYWPVQVLYLLMVRKAEQGKVTEAYGPLVMALRSLREWLGNSAVCLMQDELEVYEAWHNWLVRNFPEAEQQTPAQKKAFARRKQLVQLEIKYWNLTKPKTSRKQMRYLQELLEPNYLSKLQARVLELV